MKTLAILVTHSHWDREWYWSEEQTRFRLADLIDRLMDILRDEPDYHSFWLDGQTIPVADYAEARPERMAEFEDWLRKGKIRIGPWYVLADEHLVSGEACIRNLLLGLAQSSSFGQRHAIGYMPDTFGHIDQLPQILRGFGIDNAIFWRGYDKERIDAAETTWTGRNGDRVKAVCLVGGYSNTRGVTADLDATADRIDALMPTLQRHALSGTLLLMNGIDHALPLPGIPKVLTALQKRFPGLAVKHAGLDDYLRLVADQHEGHIPLHGELFHVPSLDGCLSNRPAQKRLNRLLENRLAHYAEPLSVLAGDAVPPALVRRAWTLLLQGHPHDTICGCHSDTVARDMENRLERGLQITEEVENRAMHALLGSRHGYGKAGLPCQAAIFNPLPWPRDEVVELDVPLPPNQVKGDLQVETLDGQPLESRVCDLRPGHHSVFHDYKIPAREPVVHARLRVAVRGLPPMGITRLRVSPRGSSVVSTMESTGRERTLRRDTSAVRPPPDVLENAHLKAVIHPDGSLDLLDKQSGILLPGLNRLHIQPDHGDLYHFAPGLEDPVTATQPGSLSRTSDDLFFQSIRVQTSLALRGIPVPVTLDVALAGESKRLEIRVSLDNAVRDFRLQAAFPIPSDGTGLAHTPFSLTPRTPVPPQESILLEKSRRLRTNSVCQPLQYMAQFNLHGAGALAVLSRGLCEYTWEQADRPCLSLMRAAGRVIDEFSEYGAESGQCRGAQAFEYALTLPADTTGCASIREAYAFNLPPKALPLFADPPPAPAPCFNFGNKHWMPAAFKRAESGSGHVLRFWNASGTEEVGEIAVPLSYTKAVRMRPDETPLEPLPCEGGRIRLTAAPFEIVTLLLDR